MNIFKKVTQSVPRFTMLHNLCELCQSALYIDEDDTRFCSYCDWFEKIKKSESA